MNSYSPWLQLVFASGTFPRGDMPVLPGGGCEADLEGWGSAEETVLLWDVAVNTVCAKM